MFALFVLVLSSNICFVCNHNYFLVSGLEAEFDNYLGVATYNWVDIHHTLTQKGKTRNDSQTDRQTDTHTRTHTRTHALTHARARAHRFV